MSHIEVFDQFNKLATDESHSRIYTLNQLFYTGSLPIDGGAILAGEGFEITHDYSLDAAEIPLQAAPQELVGRFALRYVRLYPQMPVECLSLFRMSAEEQGNSLLRGKFTYLNGEEEMGCRTAVQGIKADTPAAIDSAFSLTERLPSQGLFNSKGFLATSLDREVREHMPPTETFDPESALLHRAINVHPELAFLGLEAGLHKQTLPTLARWATRMLKGE